MKRKNILKFVSLLGIGSFVMLAAASCSQANTSTPNPNSSSTNSNPNPAMESVNQELVNAKKTLSDVLATQGNNIMLYVDYAKIQDTLMKAYASAKAVFDSSSSTVQNIKDAQSTLESAISAADKAKKDFDEKNADLVTAYNGLKESLKSEEANLESVKEANYSALKANFERLYTQAKEIVKATLDPVEKAHEADNVKRVNMALMNAITRNDPWKRNADNLVNNFVKVALAKDKLEGISSEKNMVQPGNHSFFGYSVDVDGANFSFARRTVWQSLTHPVAAPEGENQQAVPLTDVSWIYSLSGNGAKYTLNFRNFGPSKEAWLYFPYKLVKSGDASNVALQYKLNGGENKNVEFKNSMEAAASSIRLVDSHESVSTAHAMNEAPTVNDIKVAKVHLSDLKFNLNTVEFSVPIDKVAPMIGNMYLTSSDKEENRNKIYNDIFGNKVSENNSVTVDLLKGYSLSASHFTYIRRFTGLKEAKTNDPVYLVGVIGAGNHMADMSLPNRFDQPNLTGDNRTFIVYVNAPQAGDYYISSDYLNGSQNARKLRFTNMNSSESQSNPLTISVMNKTDWETLGRFDTSNNTNISDAESNMMKTLNLKQGWNKVVIAGVESGETPYIGNLAFTLKASGSPASTSHSS